MLSNLRIRLNNKSIGHESISDQCYNFPNNRYSLEKKYQKKMFYLIKHYLKTFPRCTI